MYYNVSRHRNLHTMKTAGRRTLEVQHQPKAERETLWQGGHESRCRTCAETAPIRFGPDFKASHRDSFVLRIHALPNPKECHLHSKRYHPLPLFANSEGLDFEWRTEISHAGHWFPQLDQPGHKHKRAPVQFLGTPVYPPKRACRPSKDRLGNL